MATVDNIDWPSTRTLTTEQQRKELVGILDTCKDMNLNAVILQVRPSADALYPSRFEPWSAYLTNEQGKAPNPKWDPLKFAVDEAHKRGLELHCWFNPYRATHPVQKTPNAKSHISKQHPDVVRKYGGYDWMDPGEPFVQQRSIDVMLDVVKRYDIDGVHIDDYFYPYPVNDANKQKVPFPDDRPWSAYVAKGGKLNRSDWRRKNVDDFIERLYKGIKKTKRTVKFGISPFGIYRPGYPAGIKAGVDQYEDLYADARKWLVEGWCDYFTPQLYWPIKQTAQSYPTLYQWWLTQNPKQRHLWPGLFTGRTDPAEGNWSPQEVVDQIAITRKTGQLTNNDAPSFSETGNVHFSMKAFMHDFNSIRGALKKGPYASLAAVPPSPWLDATKPSLPHIRVHKDSDGIKVAIDWDKNARFYAIRIQIAKQSKNGAREYHWLPWNRSSNNVLSWLPEPGETLNQVAAVTYSKSGIPSDLAVSELNLN